MAWKNCEARVGLDSRVGRCWRTVGKSERDSGGASDAGGIAEGGRCERGERNGKVVR